MTNNLPMSSANDLVRPWLDQQGVRVEDLTVLTGDVSLRQYVRVHHDDHQTSIVAVYPGEIRSACRNFEITSRLLTAAGVRVPRILASDCDQGLMLIEDVGSATLYDLHRTRKLSSSLSSYFRCASDDLVRIQSVSADDVRELNPPLDGDLLYRELGQTWSCLLEPRGVVADPGFSKALETALEQLCRRLELDPQAPCHRDFMARNLVPLKPSPELAVLDHQDLRLGPRYYDLASLLNDSLFPSEDLEEEILRQHAGAHAAEERVLYHRAAAQRTLKATGTYETFALRGFERHRNLIPETLSRAVRHLRQVPELTDVVEEFAQRLTPQSIC